MSGFAGWFTADFHGTEANPCPCPVTLSTGPENGYTHWGQQVFHLQVPHDVVGGGKVEGTIAVKRQMENVRLVSAFAIVFCGVWLHVCCLLLATPQGRPEKMMECFSFIRGQLQLCVDACSAQCADRRSRRCVFSSVKHRVFILQPWRRREIVRWRNVPVTMNRV